MACDIDDLISEAAWNLFLKRLKVIVAKKFGKRAALALAAALVDGPIPIGDIVALLLLLWGIVDTIYGFGELLYNWRTWREALQVGIRRVIRILTDRFGDNVLDNECVCEALKKYIRQVARNMMANKATATRRNTQALRQLLDDVTECLA